MAVGAPGEAGADGPHPREPADEARRRPRQGARGVAPPRHQGRSRTQPPSLTRSTARSCARRAGAKAATCCAPTCRGRDPAELWRFYIQLVEVEAAFKNLKDDLQLRPIYHQLESRIEAHIFVAFLAYCLHVTLRARLRPMAAGLTPRAVLDKLAAIQMLDVHFPTTDGRTLILSRYTEPNVDQKLLLQRLGLALPPQPPPRIAVPGPAAQLPLRRHVVETFDSPALIPRPFPLARYLG